MVKRVLIVTVVVIAIGVGYFVFFIQNSETKDWQLYTNEQLGIEFKYPKDSNLGEIGPASVMDDIAYGITEKRFADKLSNGAFTQFLSPIQIHIKVNEGASSTYNFYTSDASSTAELIRIGKYQVAKTSNPMEKYNKICQNRPNPDECMLGLRNYFYHYVILESEQLIVEFFAPNEYLPDEIVSGEFNTGYDKVIENIISTFKFN